MIPSPGQYHHAGTVSILGGSVPWAFASFHYHYPRSPWLVKTTALSCILLESFIKLRYTLFLIIVSFHLRLYDDILANQLQPNYLRREKKVKGEQVNYKVSLCFQSITWGFHSVILINFYGSYSAKTPANAPVTRFSALELHNC